MVKFRLEMPIEKETYICTIQLNVRNVIFQKIRTSRNVDRNWLHSASFSVVLMFVVNITNITDKC